MNKIYNTLIIHKLKLQKLYFSDENNDNKYIDFILHVEKLINRFDFLKFWAEYGDIKEYACSDYTKKSNSEYIIGEFIKKYYI